MSYMNTDEESELLALAHDSIMVRVAGDSFKWTPEMLDGHPELLQEFVELTEQEAVLFDDRWNPESAMASEHLLHQRDVLGAAITEATVIGAQVLVFVVWDGVPLRMALAAGITGEREENSHWTHTTIAPCIGEFPAMTNWGHLRLLHGLRLENGLAQGLGLNGINRAHVPLATYWQIQGNELTEGWQSLARESLVGHTAETLEPLLSGAQVSYGGYTGHQLGNLQSNVLNTLVEAMESHQTIVTERGVQGEMGQLARLRNVLSLDQNGDGVTLVFSRISFDSRGSGGELRDRHMALNFSGHEYGPYNPTILSGLRRSWEELCEVVENSLNGRKALIVACSDHGMTPAPNTIPNTWANLAPELAGAEFLTETDGGTPWFSSRGSMGSLEIAGELERLIQQTSALACSIDSAQIPNTELTAMSLRHGWSFDTHRGQHGGIGFDDLVIPYMRRIIK
jgi:hypothetical protein